MRRVIIVSNRVPDPTAGTDQAGGLVVAVGDTLQRSGGLWFGWSGKLTEEGTTAAGTRRVQRGRVTYATIDLPAEEFRGYYAGYSNGVLWPVLHQLTMLQAFRRSDLEAYQRVNGRFAEALVAEVGKDDLIWVQDYHHFTLPGELRARGVTNPIGFFLHIPFAPASAMAQAPGIVSLMTGVLAADLLGFQTAADREHFMSTAELLLGATRVGNATLRYRGRIVRLGVYPAEIDPLPWAETARIAVRSEAARRLCRSTGNTRLIIGVDRLDPTKGLLERVESFRQLLESRPRWHGEATMLQIAPPSREDVPAYQELRQKLDHAAGALNSAFAGPDWTPLRLVARNVPRRMVAGYMRVARVGLVAPVRDGMNLVAKEYVAAQDPEDPGVLILSHFAGAAAQLEKALLVNPYDAEEMADALHQALSMDLVERRRRWEALWDVVAATSAADWGARFVADLLAGTEGIVQLRVAPRAPMERPTSGGSALIAG